MHRLREWGFPVALVVGWMFAATYTVSFLIGPERSPAPAVPASISDSNLPAT